MRRRGTRAEHARVLFQNDQDKRARRVLWGKERKLRYGSLWPGRIRRFLRGLGWVVAIAAVATLGAVAAQWLQIDTSAVLRQLGRWGLEIDG